MKNVKKIAALFLISVITAVSLSGCSYSDRNAIIAEPTVSAASRSIETLELPEAFKSFTCSGDDYVSYDCEKDGCKFRFANGKLSLRNADGKTTDVVKINADLKTVAYIKDAVYFSTVFDYEKDASDKLEEQKLYRLVVDENGKYDKNSFSLVAEYLAVPSFIEENNKMILNVFVGQDSVYKELDTGTGLCSELYDSKLNIPRLDYENLPSGALKADYAEKKAIEEAEKSKYNLSDEEYNFSFLDETILYKKPDFAALHYSQWMRTVVSEDFCKRFVYEKAPDYCYRVKLKAISSSTSHCLNFTIYINALSGEISFAEVVSDVTLFD